MRYLITVSYDGSKYYGFQKLNNNKSIQGELEKALTKINKSNVFVKGSGRTDRGVHAKGQVAHFDLDIDITLYKLKCALNSLLPDDIHVIDTEVVDDSFHARFMAKKKKYVYYLNVGEYDPLKRNYIYQYNHELDVNKMIDGIKFYIGKHNFKNFVSDDCIKEDYEREIYNAYIEVENNIIKFVFIGNGFMKYQVRNMVGTLIKVGKNKINSSDIEKILIDDNYKKLVMTAKSEGLYLEEVSY